MNLDEFLEKLIEIRRITNRETFEVEIRNSNGKFIDFAEFEKIELIYEIDTKPFINIIFTTYE